MNPEAEAYVEALARERVLVVKIHNLETQLAAARMAEANARRDLARRMTLKHLAGFLAEVDDEVMRARKKHAPINSAHEGHSVILEEVEEFWDEVKLKREARDPEKMWNELVQVAAMAMRTAEDVVKPKRK